MYVGRFEGAGTTSPWWGIVDHADGHVRRIDAPFAEWAERVAGQRDVATTDPVHRLADLRVLAPLEPPGRVFGLGANYWEHLRRLGWEAPPQWPVAFVKPDSAIIGPGDEIRYPHYATQLDYEVELVAVVGRPLASVERPSDCLLGFTVGNDVSVRDAQSPAGGMDLFTMKGADGASPLGPWIATASEVGGSGHPNLKLTLSVNGEQRQDGNSKDAIFQLDEMLVWLDDRNALRPGDVIFTGSPEGPALETGTGYLEPGDVVIAEIESVGVLSNVVGPRESAAAPSVPH